MKAANYHIEVHADPGAIGAKEWNELLTRQGLPSPFMRHEYLQLLHTSGCATAATGWQPQFITLRRDGHLVAACPAYLKNHSYGEYVFDWSWAQAYQRHGLRYYPKLVVAVPFTPVAGARLMAEDAESRAVLADAVRELAQARGASSAHVLFCPEGELQAVASQADWLRRDGLQFHWQQDAAAPWPSFDEFLASLHGTKRKKILQERRRVREQGIEFVVRQGPEISREEWSFFYRCYQSTYHEHGSTPYLSEAFFQALGQQMPENWLLFLAHRRGEPVAASLLAIDPQTRSAFGRYWGCVEDIACLHFEACYYQPLQWCMANGMLRFEGGAQGTHKLARGLLPAPTYSLHWVAHEGFRQALAEHLVAERADIHEAAEELAARSPVKPQA